MSEDLPKPLSARSALLSLLLGAPAEGLSAAQLVAVAAHLGIGEPTARVALSRAVGAGELRREGTTYRLGERLLTRRRHQEERDSVRAWDGSWELVVVTATGRTSKARAATRTLLAAARLAELREGVWTRPANLARPAPTSEVERLEEFRATPADDPVALAARLWDLEGWSVATRATLALLEATAEPAHRLAVAARLVRLLAEDPLLPDELLPPDWPAARARERYAAYQGELHALAAVASSA
ncbi:PaaX family transcriptional regulator C-terminal domain-containing protein [Nocardioides campestrisoli]|uniref:PaaX family transcriptional regulator C-terminal domain-containing protein n=1 Tax=Nocardioides campestrisoli TaxID=2736757 RepID=UPI0015E63EE3|nr:PaaX family transcriptional regulator C-terminal domain-containing protein [Nocardioides campestrisoli]